MAELSTLARPYAKAAFEFAVAADALPRWSAMLHLLTALTQNPTVAGLLASPGLTPAAKAEKIVATAGDVLDAKGINFVHTLAENRRLPLLPHIAEQFEALKADLEKTLEVDVIATSELDVGQQEKLIAALTKRLQRKVAITVAVDPALRGGAIIRAGDTTIDGSVRGRLARLAEALSS